MPERSTIVAQYNPNQSIYTLRLVGTIDAYTLNEAGNKFARLLTATIVPDTLIKFLLNVHEAVWDSEHTHMEVRRVLQQHQQPFKAYRQVSAILNRAYTFHTSATEAFFTDEQAALNWLESKQ